MFRRFFKLIVSLAEMVWIFFYWMIFSKRKSPPLDPQGRCKILIFGYCGLGDMIFLLPALQAVRRWFTKAHIVLMVGPYSAAKDLVQPGVQADEVRVLDWVNASWKKKYQICREIRRENYDACLVSYPNPVRFFLTALFTIPRRVGHCRKFSTPRARVYSAAWLFSKLRIGLWEEEYYRRFLFNYPIEIKIEDHSEHDIAKNMRMALALGVSDQFLEGKPLVSISQEASSLARLRLEKEGMAPGDLILGVSLGVSRGMEWKRWSVHSFAQLIEKLCEEFHLQVLLFGSREERFLEAEFKEFFTGPVFSVVGRTSVLEMAAFLHNCRLFVSNDCGPAKLAMALGVPTAIIWGPSDRFGAGPWEKGPYRTIHNAMPCSPCFMAGLTNIGEGVLNHFNCGHRNCLNGLAVDFALSEIRELLLETNKA